MDLGSLLEPLLQLALVVVTTIGVPLAMKAMRSAGLVSDEAQAKILRNAMIDAAEDVRDVAIGKTRSSRPVDDAARDAVDYVREAAPKQTKGMSDAKIARLMRPHVAKTKREADGAAGAATKASPAAA